MTVIATSFFGGCWTLSNRLTVRVKWYIKRKVEYLLRLEQLLPQPFGAKGIFMIRVISIANLKTLILSSLIIFLLGCAPGSTLTYYHDPSMDFAAIRSVAVMPFQNFSRDQMAGERVRDVFANSLLATGAVYVIPSGEVFRGTARAGILNPTAPSSEEVAKFAGIIRVDAVITGTVTEYGEVRSGNTSANVISMNVQMIEVQSQKIVWTASATEGGISLLDRLFGSGGKPMNDVIMEAVDEILDKLFL